MAFSKPKLTVERVGYDLDDAHDREIITSFEKTLENDFNHREVVVPKTAAEKYPLRGYELYLHEKGIYVFSKEYPFGAVRDPIAYADTIKKWSALQTLRNRRTFAQRQETERMESLVNG
ncbi:MAG: hypothetical protein HGA33_00865 [Candidatus Moranbacteria bacterium]|nr:hypothetical protein [Candidatus Moranbacteria bacterium]